MLARLLDYLFPSRRNNRRTETLLRLLSDERFEFRKLSTLSAAIGAMEKETSGILRTIGARPAYRNETLWGLMSRVGSRAVARY